MDLSIQHYAISLKVILKRKDWKVLVIKVPEGPRMWWYYDLPWWRIDVWEFKVDLLDILWREIYEELWNIKFQLQWTPIANARVYCKPCEKYNYEEYIFYNFYEWRYLWGDIKLSNEHCEYKWIDLEGVNIETYFLEWFRDGIVQYLQLKNND